MDSQNAAAADLLAVNGALRGRGLRGRRPRRRAAPGPRTQRHVEDHAGPRGRGVLRGQLRLRLAEFQAHAPADGPGQPLRQVRLAALLRARPRAPPQPARPAWRAASRWSAPGSLTEGPAPRPHPPGGGSSEPACLPLRLRAGQQPRAAAGRTRVRTLPGRQHSRHRATHAARASPQGRAPAAQPWPPHARRTAARHPPARRWRRPARPAAPGTAPPGPCWGR